MSSITADSILINGTTPVANAKQTINGNLAMAAGTPSLSANSTNNIAFNNATITGLNTSANNIVVDGGINDASSCITLGSDIGIGGGYGSYYIISAGANITNFGHENIVSGRLHDVNAEYSVVLGGVGNTITANGVGGNPPTQVYMMGGNGNTVTTGNDTTRGCGIIGGESSSMPTSVGNNNLIINCSSGSIAASGAINTLIGATSSAINGASSVRNAILGGTTNTVSSTGASTNSAIIGGTTNVIARGTDCAIICSEASDILLTGTGTAVLINNGIYSGGNNEISSNVANFTNGSNAILAGDGNRIQNRVTQSAIIGSSSSDILTSGTGTLSGSVVLGGNNCNITSSSSATTGRSVICGGLNQTISSTGVLATLNSTITHGSGCTLTNNTNCLLGGVNGSISSGLSGSVVFVDGEGTAFNCGSPNRFVCKFTSGYYLASNAAASRGVQIGTDGEAWGTISSDIRTKNIHNTIDYEDILAGLDEINVYNYNYKDDNTSYGPRIGLIAQEFNGAFAINRNVVKKALSISENLNEKYGSIEDPIQTVDFSSVLYIQTACIKALKAKNVALTTRVDALEAQNAQLVNDLATIKALLGLN